MAKQSTPPIDENEGLGGSYIVDPDTGARRLVERTQDPAPEPLEPKE